MESQKGQIGQKSPKSQDYCFLLYEMWITILKQCTELLEVNAGCEEKSKEDFVGITHINQRATATEPI